MESHFSHVNRITTELTHVEELLREYEDVLDLLSQEADNFALLTADLTARKESLVQRREGLLWQRQRAT